MKNIPIYQVIENDIKEKIISGVYQPNSLIESENELKAQYNVSRMTVRQALVNLTFEGYIYREKGKGTFVSQPKNSHNHYIFNKEFSLWQIYDMNYSIELLRNRNNTSLGEKTGSHDSMVILEYSVKDKGKWLFTIRLKINQERIVLPDTYIIKNYHKLMSYLVKPNETKQKLHFGVKKINSNNKSLFDIDEEKNAYFIIDTYMDILDNLIYCREIYLNPLDYPTQ